MKLYSYVLRYDNGSAPNPFWGFCTLAICKPKIRLHAAEGDWVVGTGSVRNVGQNWLIYAMKVTKKLTFDQYFEDKAYECKKPTDATEQGKRGDNIYHLGKPRFHSVHSFDDKKKSEDASNRDLSGKYVLISEAGNFYYYGKNAREIPKAHLSGKFSIRKIGPGHKYNFPPDKVDSFLKWLQEDKPGFKGNPCEYRENENCLRNS